ncbi:hypothetical protein D3C73_1645660 [compost metagenome]
MEYPFGDAVIRDVVHFLEDVLDAVADRLQRIFRLLAVFLLDRVERDEERDNAKHK